MKHSENVTTLLFDKGFGRTWQDNIFKRGKHYVELKDERRVEIKAEDKGVKGNVEYNIKVLIFRGLVRNAEIMETVLNCCCYESESKDRK